MNRRDTLTKEGGSAYGATDSKSNSRLPSERAGRE